MNIIDAARRGEPLNDILIIDCHCHMGSWHNFNIPCNSAEGMLKSMDTLGINTVCVTGLASIGPDYRYGNDMVMRAVLKYPDRFIGYVTLNPHYQEDMQHEIDRCFAVKGFLGIKLHPNFHGCEIDDKLYHIAYQAAEKRKCHMLIHTWGKADIDNVNKIAGQYSGIFFIIGHAGGDIKGMRKAIDVVNSHNNVYVDLALSTTFEGNVEWLVNEVGSKKILYGSDMPFFDPRSTVGRIAFSDISDDEKLDIFGLNMKKILKWV